MLGLQNNKGHCFVNSLIQLFYHLDDFSTSIIQYHEHDGIVKAGGTDKEKLFVNDFCQLMFAFHSTNEVLLNKVITRFQDYFQCDSGGDDVHKCYMIILTNLHRVIDTKLNNENMEQPIDVSTSPHGFINKLFQGNMSVVEHCIECKVTIKEKEQFFKSIPLPVDNSPEASLSSCLDIFLSDSDVISDFNCGKCCENPTIKSKIIITTAPKYLILYLNRGSYFVGGSKKSSLVQSECILNIPTSSGNVIYALVSVIDHLGDSSGGHYVTKSLYEREWWIFNDEQVELYKEDAIITHNAIMFAFLKIE